MARTWKFWYCESTLLTGLCGRRCGVVTRCMALMEEVFLGLGFQVSEASTRLSVALHVDQEIGLSSFQHHTCHCDDYGVIL